MEKYTLETKDTKNYYYWIKMIAVNESNCVEVSGALSVFEIIAWV